ncbi:hypothetical protein [Streptomyces tailanensis]|uniref:hypothetical protein n=1 Tax=Streptomyces tailanensis TaxID=2569858 RepID=UPI001FE6CA8C|nr:hypothetical protein [Streptomyces tailanensis]
MRSPALAAALADIDTVFNGFASPGETGCRLCHAPEETAYLRTPYTRVPPDVLDRYLYEVSNLPQFSTSLEPGGPPPTTTPPRCAACCRRERGRWSTARWKGSAAEPMV